MHRLIPLCALLALGCNGPDDTEETEVEDFVPPCAGGTWGHITDPDDAVNVSLDGEGFGKPHNPQSDVARAFQKAIDEDKPIAFHPGTYPDLALELIDASGLVVEGCSIEEVVLQGTADRPIFHLKEGSIGFAVENVTLSGGRGAVVADEGASARLEDLVVTGQSRFGLLARGQDSALVLENIVVRDISADADGYGWGIAATELALVQAMDETRVERATQVGVFAHGSRGVFLDEVTVADTVAAGGIGRGVHVQHSYELDIKEVQVTGSTDTAIMVIKVEEADVANLEVAGVSGGHGGDGLVFTQGEFEDEPEHYSRFYSEVHDSAFTDIGRAALIFEHVETEISGIDGGGADPVIYSQGTSLIQVLDGADVIEPEEPIPLNQAVLPYDLLPDLPPQ